METMTSSKPKKTQALEGIQIRNGGDYAEVVLSINNLRAMIRAIERSKAGDTDGSACGIFALRLDLDTMHADYHGDFRAVGSQHFYTTY